MVKALQKYYLADELDLELADRHKYQPIDRVHFEAFKSELRSFRVVEFVFALYTDAAEEKLRDACQHLRLEAEQIKFTGRCVPRGECFLDATPAILTKQKTRFRQMLKDYKFLNGIFDLAGESGQRYEKRLKMAENSGINLVARKNSVPKAGANLFQIIPRDTNVRPLFNRIEEHGAYD